MNNHIVKPNFLILDCLRGIAAFYVVINHCRGNLLIGGSELAEITPIDQWGIWTKAYYALLRLTSLGTEFVVVFFVLSGYSIAYSLYKKPVLKYFFLKRFIRLYPPYVAALVWAALVFWLIAKYFPSFNLDLKSVFDNWKSIAYNMFYISEGAYISQFWSLAHEVIFYLLAPLALLKRNYYYILSVLFYLSGLIIGLNEFTGNSILTKFLFDYNIYFTVGIWLFHNYKTVQKIFSCNKIKTYLIFIVFFVTMVILKYVIGEYNKITPFLAALLSVFLIINFQTNNIKSNILLFLGGMSYTLYITHFASIKFFNLLLLKSGFVQLDTNIVNPFIWIIGALFCIVISFVFYNIAERPTKLVLARLRKSTTR